MIFTYFQVDEAEEVLIDEPVHLTDGEQIITDEQQVKQQHYWKRGLVRVFGCSLNPDEPDWT